MFGKKSAIILVLLVVVSVSIIYAGGDMPTTENNDMPTTENNDMPTTENNDMPTTENNEFAYPTGADATDIDTALLVQNHNTTLTEKRFVSTYRNVTEMSQSSESSRLTRTFNYGKTDNLVSQTRTSGRDTTYYVDNSTSKAYLRYVIDNETSYQAIDGQRNEAGERYDTESEMIETQLNRYETSFTQTTTVDGTDVAEYQLVSIADDSIDGGYTVDGTVAVAEDGYIKQLTIKLTSGDGYVESHSFLIEDVGSAVVEEPTWVSKAENNAG